MSWAGIPEEDGPVPSLFLGLREVNGRICRKTTVVGAIAWFSRIRLRGEIALSDLPVVASYWSPALFEILSLKNPTSASFTISMGLLRQPH